MVHDGLLKIKDNQLEMSSTEIKKMTYLAKAFAEG